MFFFQDKLSRNKTVLANFSYLSLLQVFTILFPFADLSLFATGHRVGIVWSDRICPDDYQLCIVGDKFRIQYVRSEGRGGS